MDVVDDEDEGPLDGLDEADVDDDAVLDDDCKNLTSFTDKLLRRGKGRMCAIRDAGRRMAEQSDKVCTRRDNSAKEDDGDVVAKVVSLSMLSQSERAIEENGAEVGTGDDCDEVQAAEDVLDVLIVVFLESVLKSMSMTQPVRSRTSKQRPGSGKRDEGMLAVVL